MRDWRVSGTLTVADDNRGGTHQQPYEVFFKSESDEWTGECDALLEEATEAIAEGFIVCATVEQSEWLDIEDRTVAERHQEAMKSAFGPLVENDASVEAWDRLRETVRATFTEDYAEAVIRYLESVYVQFIPYKPGK